MMHTIPFRAPLEFLAQLEAGEVVRYGTVLKNVSDGRIVAHMQQTGIFDQVLSTAVSALPGVAGIANPVGTLTGVGTMLQNEQIKGKLDHLTGMMGNLQTLSLVGSIASVAGVGITVASTAILLNRMRIIDRGIATMQDRVAELPELWEKQNLKGVLRDLQTSMEKLAEAPLRKNAADTRRMHEDVQDDLHKSFAKLADGVQTVLTFAVQDEELLRLLLAGLATSSAAQMKSLIWLGEVPQARQRAAGQVNMLIDLSRKIPKDRLTGSYGLGVDAAARIAGDLADLRAVAASRPSLCDHLISHDLDGQGYLMEAQERDDAPVLMLPSN